MERELDADAGDRTMDPATARSAQRRLRLLDSATRPFDDPVYWAPFTFVGL